MRALGREGTSKPKCSTPNPGHESNCLVEVINDGKLVWLVLGMTKNCPIYNYILRRTFEKNSTLYCSIVRIT